MTDPRAVVHVVMPQSVDDITRPSGGNVYDVMLCNALAQRGWSVQRHRISSGAAALHEALALSDATPAIVDGLLASEHPDVIEHAGAAPVVLLVHLPLGVAASEVRAAERRTFAAAAALVVTSRWTRDWIADHYGLESSVATPGVEVGSISNGDHRRLLTVAAVTRAKGYDVLIDALTMLRDHDWALQCAGRRDLDPAFVRHLQNAIETAEIADRVTFLGAVDQAALRRAYATAGLVVHPSRCETYGMAIADGLAHGVPVIASDVGGVPEVFAGLGGLLVPPGDAASLARALRSWLEEPELREHLHNEARTRRSALPSWDIAASVVERLLQDRAIPAVTR